MTSAKRADLLLVTATFLWGLSFVVVKDALAQATPLAFIAIRFTIAALVLAPSAGLRKPWSPGEVRGGLLLALLLGGGFIAQAIGLVTTTPSRSAFIVALSSVLAPAIAAVALRERPSRWLVMALALAAVGIYLLTDPEAGGLNQGDLWTMITAVLYGGQIVAIAALSRRYDLLRLVWLQVAGTAVLGLVGAGVLESVRLEWSPRLWFDILFSAILATAIPLVLQIRAQQVMSSARAALLFCCEAVFASLTSWLVIGERLSAAQWIGGGLILAGMVMADLRTEEVLS
jgi:drug/metabolite transporter (DMT)-like permease